MAQSLSITIPLLDQSSVDQPAADGVDDDASVDLCVDAASALFWPGGSTLFIADPHFGKAATFHHAGIAIPSKLLNHDLARLDKLVTAYGAQHLVILGDFFHTQESQSQGVLEQLAAWRAHNAALQVSLVPGNHDMHAGAPPDTLAITPLAPDSRLGPFCLAHEPLTPNELNQHQTSSAYRLAGHLHPAVTLHGHGGTTMSERCFVIGTRQAILPAFGSFTGRMRYMPRATDRIFVVGEGQVVEITRRQPPNRRPIA